MTHSRHLRLIVALLIVAVASVLGARPVAAHTAFDSSTPSEGSVVTEPVTLVTIAFTNPATPFGDEFIALTPEGVTQLPVEVQTLDDKLFTLRFDPPLTGGQVGVRWEVRAGDAHPIEGAFAFTVDAPAAATTVPATTTPVTTVDDVPAQDTEAAGETDTDTAATTPTPADGAGDATDAEPDTAGAVIDAEANEAEGGGVADPDVATAAPAGSTSLDEFLAVDNSRPGDTTATVGRLVSFLGITIAIGGLAFLAAVLRGRRGEIDRGLAAVRLLGLLVVVGAAAEYVGVTRIAGESLGAAWSTAPGFATVLRMLGGLGLLVGLSATLMSAGPSTARSLSAAVIDDVTGEVERTGGRSAELRWTPTRASWPALAGVGLIVASFWFDGHTVSKGFRPLHALVNSVHLLAGSVWVGGVVAMAAVAWSRHRSGRSTGAAAMVIRFSKVATLALASVVVAGLVMAFLVLDSFGELTGTPWGKILLLKTGAVGLAALGGAYNHFRLLPALEADPESPELQAELRSTVTAEAIMLVFVVIVTAWLVAAAS